MDRGSTRLADAGFPHGLLAPDGAWLLVGRPDGIAAAEHTSSFGGRSVCLIDERGEIRATRLTESIQTRRYIAVPELGSSFEEARHAQVVSELQLDRTHAPTVRAVAKSREFDWGLLKGLWPQ